jgi:hypothetical protein
VGWQKADTQLPVFLAGTRISAAWPLLAMRQFKIFWSGLLGNF